MYKDQVQAAKILSELCSGRKIDTLFDRFLKEEKLRITHYINGRKPFVFACIIQM